MTEKPELAEASVALSIVIPVYNSGKVIVELTDRLVATLATLPETTYEIIFIDDGSSDTVTLDTLRKLSNRPYAHALILTRNFGKPAAIMCGLKHASGDQVLTIDDDLQQRPEDIPRLVALGGHDVVVATHTKKMHTFGQRIASRIKGIFDRMILGHSVPMAPMKLIQRHVVDGMLSIKTTRPFIPALISEVTTDIVGVDVPHDASAMGPSRYTWLARWRQFSNLIFGNSALLMQAMTWAGLVVMTCSFGLAAYVVMRKLSGFSTEPGWSSLMFAILLIGGLNLGAIGVAGQYFVRILDTVTTKPTYLVRETLGGSNRTIHFKERRP